MEGRLLLGTYFLAGRATRFSRNSVLLTARAAARAAAWTTQRVVSSARLLNPLSWRRAGCGRLERKILETRAAEQRRIGQDLHDGVGQILTGVAFMGRALERKLAADLPDRAADAAQIAETAEEGMARTRSMARVLNPVRLEAGGLKSALGEMAYDFEKVFGVPCTFEHDGGVVIDDEVVATHLYRMAQEAATNAIRHGRAKHVMIRLGSDGECITLVVQDDGTGFAAAETMADEAEGMGLRIMDYRAKMVGGALTIRRQPEGGTLLTCAFPTREKRR